MPSLPSKPCARCGREFSWRKKWERCWDEVRYCGEKCRRGRLDEVDEAAYRSQCAKVEAAGGREAIMARGKYQGTPAPGHKPIFMT